MSRFYVIGCNGIPPIARVRLKKRHPGGPWMKGRPIKRPIETPIKYEISPKVHGNLKVLYPGLSIPLMRIDLIDTIRKAGVDNIEYFEAVIIDPEKTAEITDYKAFNIVGLVSAADMSKSIKMHNENLSALDIDFDSLVLDHEKIPKNLLTFRLAESLNAIVVHENVKNEIEKQIIEGIVFYEDGEWSG